MTETELLEKEEQNWLRVDAALRDKCVWHLREVLAPEDQAWIREAFASGDWPLGFHMFGGMAVRNALREVVSDDELPDVEYTHVIDSQGPISANGHPLVRNWDDFYMAALRQTVAPKEGEV